MSAKKSTKPAAKQEAAAKTVAANAGKGAAASQTAADKPAAVKKEIKPIFKTETKSALERRVVSMPLDIVLWIVSLLLIAGAIGGNYYYQHINMGFAEGTYARLGRVAIVIATIVVGLAVTLFTNKGRQLLKFGRESYVELRKVVWPTRTEAVQTTFIVFVAVCVVSLFLYLCDIVFLQIVRFITL